MASASSGPSISMRTVAPTDAVSSITATMLRALARLPFTDSDTVERNLDAMATMRAHARACKPSGLMTDTSLVCIGHLQRKDYTNMRRTEIPLGAALSCWSPILHDGSANVC